MKNFKNDSLLCLSQKGFKGDNKNIVIKTRECWRWKIKK